MTLPAWILLFVMYYDGMPLRTDSVLLSPSKVKTAEDCEKVAEQARTIVEDDGMQYAAECRPLLPAPPKVEKKPKPSDPASEVKS